jgi:hypothetical protein
MEKFDRGGVTVMIDPSSELQVPIYNLAFRTGRNQEFSTVTSASPKP